VCVCELLCVCVRVCVCVCVCACVCVWQDISPYHRIPAAAAAAGALPAVLLTTSTRDDRVHPAHARKMVKRLRDAAAGGPGAGRVYYYENVEGGHGGAVDSRQRAYVTATIYSFLYKTIAASGLGR
jgi:prolyl oligopeptidase